MGVKGNLSKPVKKSTGGLSVTAVVAKALEAIPVMLLDMIGLRSDMLKKSNVGHKHTWVDIVSIDGGTWDDVPAPAVLDCGYFGQPPTISYDSGFFDVAVMNFKIDGGEF